MNETFPTADELFVAELARRDLTYVINEAGLYQISLGEVEVTVNLENVRRNYGRDHDAGVVARFARQLDVDPFDEELTWQQAQPLLRYSLEHVEVVGADQSVKDDTLHEVVNDQLLKVFVFILPDGSRIAWLTPDMAEHWGVSVEEIIRQADRNMDQVVEQAQFDVETVNDVPLGMLSTTEMPFKASLIASPKFRGLVSPTHGWPVYVVAPARDFLYVVPKANADFLGQLGEIVLREYHQSGHPLTPDVLEVGDEGIQAIGSFAPRDEG